MRYCLLLMMLFVLVVLLFLPFRFAFEFDSDEGLQLMRSFLFLRGHSLYGDVFSDQPPAFSLILTFLFSVLNVSVTIGRLLVLGFSALLLGSVAYLLAQTWGTPHAVAGSLVLFLLPYYLQLSVSVMIGLPAIALATTSLLWLTLWHRQKARRWLILSGLFLGLSVMTKLFTVLLLPISIGGILIQSWQDRGGKPLLRTRLAPSFYWGVGFALATVPIGLLAIGPTNLLQLLRLPFEAQAVEFYAGRAEVQNIDSYLQYSVWILLAAGLGALRGLQRRKWTTLYFLAWSAAAYLSLRQLIPVWYHHQHLVTVPAAVLAGIFIGESIELGHQVIHSRKFLSRQAALALVMVAISGYVVGERVPSVLLRLQSDLPNLNPGEQLGMEEYELLAVMSDHREQTKLIVTDRPMYAFRLRKEVPPELAVFSEKRLYAGELTEDQVLATIRAKRPAQVLFTRFTLGSVESYLREEYEAAYISGKLRLYLRPELLTDF